MSKEQIEMRSCPFCGNVAELHERYHSIEEIAYKKSEIPKDAKFLYEKVYTKKRIYVYRRKTFIPRCTDTSCVGRTTKIFFDKDIAIDAWNRRADMSKEQIEEMRIGCPMRHENGNCLVAGGFCTAVNTPICEALHNAYDTGKMHSMEEMKKQGYRKQSEGEWKLGKSGCMYFCSSCGYSAFPREEEEWNFCPRCGTKMKGGAE